MKNDDEMREAVRGRYAQIAAGERTPEAAAELEANAAARAESCCAPQQTSSASSCCGAAETASKVEAAALAVGYSAEELVSIPDEAKMGLGCGNPIALASLQQGEVVVDLGAGGGIDCFLAAKAVGQGGSVIGVDMTSEMVSRARENARQGGYENVDFRLGEIEHLPVADASVDAVVSNCVINLSPDKPQVFREAYRVLRPGGRVMVSDIVLLRELPEHIMTSVEAYAGCVAGAFQKDDYLAVVKDAGFEDVTVVSETPFGWGELEGAISSINVRALKPR